MEEGGDAVDYDDEDNGSDDDLEDDFSPVDPAARLPSAEDWRSATQSAAYLPDKELTEMLRVLQSSGRFVEALQLMQKNTTLRSKYWQQIFRWALVPSRSGEENQELFRHLTQTSLSEEDDSQVQKDIPRTAKWLAGSAGAPKLDDTERAVRLERLEHVLHAFLSSCSLDVRTDEEPVSPSSAGSSSSSSSFYMQGMNGLAFILLEVVENDEVEAFRFLRGIVARILPHVFGICCEGTGRDHFDLFRSLVEVGDVLQEVARLHLPNFHAALERAGLPVCLLAYKWFPTLFSDVTLTASHSQLRFDTLLCCWDVCLLLGLEGMFCVALALCSAAEDDVLALAGCGGAACNSAEQVSATVGRSLALLTPEDLITSVCEVLELCSHPVLLKLRNGHRRRLKLGYSKVGNGFAAADSRASRECTEAKKPDAVPPPMTVTDLDSGKVFKISDSGNMLLPTTTPQEIREIVDAALEGNLATVQRLVSEAVAIDKEEALRLAATGGHLAVVQYLIEGSRALVKAAYNGKIDAVRCLVEEYDMDVNVTNDDGYTCLMKAAYTALVIASRNGKIEVIRYLAEQCGADINVVNKEGFTALSVAAADGDTNIARYLADGCRAAVRDGKSAPMRAAENGRIEIVQYLVEKCDADVDVKDNDGNTALMKAAENGKLEVVQYLDTRAMRELLDAALEGNLAAVQMRVGGAGATDKEEVLRLAAAGGHLGVVQYLAKECDVDVNAARNDGETAVMMAASNGMMEVIRYLAIQCNVVVNVRNQGGDTALMKAVYNGKVEVVRCLVEECGVGVNAKSYDGETALMKAISTGAIEVVHYLAKLESTDINARNYDEDTALLIATKIGKLEVIRYLAEQCGADVNDANEKGFTALLVAAQNGDINVVRYLADECDADVNRKTKGGSTALSIAAASGKIEVVQYLAEKFDAKVRARDENGYIHAARNGHIDVLKYLVEPSSVDKLFALCKQRDPERDNQWDLVKRMCVLNPEERIKISTVVDEFDTLANASIGNQTENYIETSAIGSVESVSRAISEAREMLVRPQGSTDRRDAVLSLYVSLWDSLEEVKVQLTKSLLPNVGLSSAD
ncbi:hypothetical protein JG688_00003251 [Phytophthora aleatoria]|uniref:Rab-GAP TBC domain-containing protein n=1 Tax=Phytophthora aleatoria TaxID=2496075 RepID=A0A8J5MC76_9STRA|nr:hypothetical protein JG688_00003251 [Phytophthora aleatoria]